MNTLYIPQLLYLNGSFVTDRGILVDEAGKILKVAAKSEDQFDKVVHLSGKALLPGFVNAHSHSFQRLIRGKSESRVSSGNDFWSWRATMYHAASELTPDELFDVARMAFLEMIFAGTTTVGEFHYLHTNSKGHPYEDPNLLSKRVIAAASSVGIRIVLLRAAYLRSGFELPLDTGQMRFFESTREFIGNMDSLITSFNETSSRVGFGVAPHSIRAVPLADLKEIAAWGRTHNLPIHMHVAEQVAENSACLREYGYTPVELLSRNGILGPAFTAVHAIHTSPEEVAMLAHSNSIVCSCPTTERNLGDGILEADHMSRSGISIALGSDSQAQIDPLEDAREIDYHLRLRDQERAVLDQIEQIPLAARLFDCSTVHGARALAVPSGTFTPGSNADAFTIDLDDLSIAGHSPDDLLSIAVFSLSSRAINDVMVQGDWILQEQKHPLQNEIVARYKEVHNRVWNKNSLARLS